MPTITRNSVVEGTRYLFNTVASASLSLGLPFALHEYLLFSENVAVAAGLLTVFLVNFITLKFYVFKSSGPALPQLWKFAWTSLLFRTGEYIIFLVLNSYQFTNYIVCLAFVLIVSLTIKFIVYRLFVFSHEASAVTDLSNV